MLMQGTGDFSLLRMMFYLLYSVGIAGLFSCSKVDNNATFVTQSLQLSDKDRVEKHIEWNFVQCRNVHFEDSILVNNGDYVTLIYFEVPETELKALLKNSARLSDYELLKDNEYNLKVMEGIGKDRSWWDINRLQHAIIGTTSWSSGVTNGGECVHYSHSTVAVAAISDKWNAVYICYVTESETWPKF